MLMVDIDEFRSVKFTYSPDIIASIQDRGQTENQKCKPIMNGCKTYCVEVFLW